MPAGKTFVPSGKHDNIKGKTKEPEMIVKEEFGRIKKSGAKVAAKPYKMGESEMRIATFADPDGNYFQPVTPRKEEEK